MGPECTTSSDLGLVGSGPTLGGTSTPGNEPVGGDIHDGTLYLVVREMPGRLASVFAVDLDSGERTLISGVDNDGNTRGTGDELGPDGGSLRMSSDGMSAFVNVQDGLYEIDIATGNRTSIRAWGNGDGTACDFVNAGTGPTGGREFALLDDDDTFFFGYNSNSEYRRGYIRFTRSSGSCEAFSRCEDNTTGVDGYGSGPCFINPPRALQHFDVPGFESYLWSLHPSVESLFRIDIETGERVRISRSANNDTNTVGGGDGCVHQEFLTWLGGEIWTSGESGGCFVSGDLNISAIDPATGDRRSFDLDSGPNLGQRTKAVWSHPQGSWLVVSAPAEHGIALYDPETQAACWISR